MPPVVFLLDDKESELKALGRMLRASGFEVRAWSDPHRFLAEHDPEVPGCLVLDALTSGPSGLDVQQELMAVGARRCIVFISASTDVSISQRAMKAGAFTFLCKPVRIDDLAATVQAAIHKDAFGRESRRLMAA